MMLSLFFISSLFAQTPVFEITRTSEIAAPALTPQIRQLPLELMVEEGSMWAQDKLMKDIILQTSKIFRRCKLEIGGVKLNYVKYSPDVLKALNNPNPYLGPEQLVLMKGNVPVSRPMGFLFAKSIPSTAKAFNKESVGRITTATIDAQPLVETFHITEQWIDYRQVPGAIPAYSTFAHELAHLMGNFGHIPVKGNLMSSLDGRGSKSDGLTPEQCTAMNAYEFISQ